MSTEAMTWADRQDFTRFPESQRRALKLALLMLADGSADDGEGNLYPDLERCAERSLMTLNQLKSCLQQFEGAGWLVATVTRDGPCYHFRNGVDA